jgi:hypothetical protein
VSLKEGGGETSLTLYTKEGERYLCSSSANPYPFHLAAYAAERFLQHLEELVKK